eukprot:TRINITY_DN76443_c0_g1_i1.p1 TRINITY_DN76443_c0_g1~~TRINITY_DN76443_c0_g1_i1.p1  ORF type:complete len:308 (+),score=13.31 TRINITY_DN76443_c0_g1_i1:39-962(+)
MEGGPRPWNVLDMLNEDRLIAIQAPMVRYSRLPFRKLCRKWGVDVAYTHMVISDSFVKSQKARDAEFATEIDEGPLVVQFAADNDVVLGRAAVLVHKYCDAIDINCGCPQRWAIKEGIGGALMAKPQLVSDMVKQVYTQLPGANFPCAVKIRLLPNQRDTISYVQQIEQAGASWISVHGRTLAQRSSTPVNSENVKLVKESLKIPVVHNGDVFTKADAEKFGKDVNGVMSARGLLYNPALFSGALTTPMECVKDYIDLAMQHGTQLQNFQHHLSCMLKDTITRDKRLELQRVASVGGMLEFLDQTLF